ncbi:MAG: ABC-F family ATP-binding cassette domain-containing protein [Saprospiraceae bacterium]|nr:ABC-F family ATP-binding cassette domain-containing protein [Saprospiraceae bacterium]
MRRQPQARTTKAQSRIDDFYELEDKVSRKVERDDMKIDIKTTWLGSKIVELHNVSKNYADRKLIENFSYKFKRGERVGIVGQNGAGKSTLIKMITSEITPDTGKVVVGETIQFGYYTQDGISLKEDQRVIEVIQDIAEFIPLEKGQKITASALLERFLFTKEQQQVYVSQLSGGEKRRLYLLTVIMRNPNFLILDEPTNDLDILTLNVLEDFLLEQYNGCLLIVTHDRYFMDKLVDHLFILEGEGKIKDHNGNYTEYREQKKMEQRATPSVSGASKSGLTDTRKANDSERKELKRVEKDIEKLEMRKRDIEARFNDVNSLKNDDITKLSAELQTIQNDLEIKELRWLELSELA